MIEPNITFHSEGDFSLSNPDLQERWLFHVAKREGRSVEQINYIFCNDEYLHKINLEFLNHDDYTDIITFDYGLGDALVSDVYVSVERVRDNAKSFNTTFADELDRVLVHGMLHLCGYKDKTSADELEMRGKENYYLSLRT